MKTSNKPKTSFAGFLPKTPRETDLMNFWYTKGYAEAELMSVVKADKRKVEIKTVNFLKSKKRRDSA